MDYERELECAREAAARAGEIALRYAGQIAFDAKSDASPVTAADRACESAIAGLLEEFFPDDGLLGEEGTEKPAPSGRRWIIDPIDGTRDFIRGNPTWAVLIALEDCGDVVMGVANVAAMGEMYHGVRGAGAFVNGEPLRASSCASVEDALLAIDAFRDLYRYPFAGALAALWPRFWGLRAMGGCYDALMVARGRFDLFFQTAGKPWDFAALKIIAEEAGARYFDFEGRNTIYGRNAVFAAPGLEGEARRLLGLR
ncbi:MAG: inositol monophosphatase [Bryobacteraceae bacterium]